MSLRNSFHDVGSIHDNLEVIHKHLNDFPFVYISKRRRNRKTRSIITSARTCALE